MDRRVRKFFNSLLETHPTLFEAKRVLEYGSMTRSGVPRNLFGKAEEYVGVDWRDGPGVDAVSLMHDYKDKPNEYFDLAVSTSALEHDPHWVHSITRVHKLLRVGGSFILTTTGIGSGQHSMQSSPRKGYYHNFWMGEVLDHTAFYNGYWRIEAEEHETEKTLFFLFLGKK